MSFIIAVRNLILRILFRVLRPIIFLMDPEQAHYSMKRIGVFLHMRRHIGVFFTHAQTHWSIFHTRADALESFYICASVLEYCGHADFCTKIPADRFLK